jgi:hypothetical protein
MGLSEIKPILHTIDCNADPFVPHGREVEEHRNGGILTWDPTKVSLYPSKSQEGDEYIGGYKLRKELASQPVLNANVLDYLLKNPHLIPEDWKKDEHGNMRFIFFWGTIYRNSVYRNSDGRLYVRCLYWNDSTWYWRNYWLGYGWSSNDFAAVRAS